MGGSVNYFIKAVDGELLYPLTSTLAISSPRIEALQL